MRKNHPFALGRFATGPNDDFIGLVKDDFVTDLTSAPGFTASLTINDVLANWQDYRELLQGIVTDEVRHWMPLQDIRTLVPLHPTNILQAGANYRKHVVQLMIAERNRDERTEDDARREALERLNTRRSTGKPYLFSGLQSAMCAAYDDIVLPLDGEEPDWELELAAVIGAPARRVSPENALDYVGGYTICDDLTLRDHIYRPDMKIFGGDFVAGKNAPTFLPTGPYVVPAEFVADPSALRIQLSVNGKVMQDETCDDMLFDVAQLVSYASHLIKLVPGDLVLTGSPAGNGTHHGRFLRPGDVVEGSITGLGYQRNVCVAESAL